MDGVFSFISYLIAAKRPFIRILFLNQRIVLFPNLTVAFLCMLILDVSALMNSAFAFKAIIITSVLYQSGLIKPRLLYIFNILLKSNCLSILSRNN